MLLTRVYLTLCVAAGAALAAEPAPGTALSKVNVFQGPAAAASTQAATETIEFIGVSTMGKRTDYIFFDKTSKKNHWIAKGETKEGITVLNYDAHREEAVVKINDAQKTLALRKGSGPANSANPGAPIQLGFNSPPATMAPSPAAPTYVTPATVAPVQTAPVATQPATKPETPTTPEGIAKAETEARMLVSDLLEIGMAQRKAYEEQQRRAAEGKTEQDTQAAQPQPPKQ